MPGEQPVHERGQRERRAETHPLFAQLPAPGTLLNQGHPNPPRNSRPAVRRTNNPRGTSHHSLQPGNTQVLQVQVLCQPQLHLQRKLSRLQSLQNGNRTTKLVLLGIFSL